MFLLPLLSNCSYAFRLTMLMRLCLSFFLVRCAMRHADADRETMTDAYTNGFF